jgi:hypothetical protein
MFIYKHHPIRLIIQYALQTQVGRYVPSKSVQKSEDSAPAASFGKVTGEEGT